MREAELPTLAFGAGEFTNTSLHQTKKQKDYNASAEMTVIEIYKEKMKVRSVPRERKEIFGFYESKSSFWRSSCSSSIALHWPSSRTISERGQAVRMK